MARQALLAMFDAYPSWRVVGNADNGERAFEECLASRPDLLLTDIRMPRLNGIELVAGLRPLLPGMRVAFITAHDQHAIAAFRLAAIDYLLKPVSDAEFLACLRRVEQDVIRQRRADAKDRAAPPVDALIRQQRERIEHLVIRSVGRIERVPLHEVVAFKATGNYIEVITTSKRYLHRQTMARLLDQLDPRAFVQTHRSAIAAIDRIRVMRRSERGGELELDSGLTLPVSGGFQEAVARIIAEVSRV